MAKQESSALLDALKSANQDDLDQIESRIDEIENELSTLKNAQRLIRKRLGVDSSSNGKERVSIEESAQKIAAAIKAAGRDLATKEISATVGIAATTVGL